MLLLTAPSVGVVASSRSITKVSTGVYHTVVGTASGVLIGWGKSSSFDPDGAERVDVQLPHIIKPCRSADTVPGSPARSYDGGSDRLNSSRGTIDDSMSVGDASFRESTWDTLRDIACGA